MKFLSLFASAALLLISNQIEAQLYFGEDFENWEDLGNGYNQPADWFTSNAFDALFGDPQSVEQSSDSYEGSFAARLTVTQAPDSDPSGSLINLTTEISDNPEVLTGWHKYNLDGDTILLRSPLFQYNFDLDTSLATGLAIAEFTGESDEYTYFSIPFDIDEGSVADTLRMIFTFLDLDLSLTSFYMIDDLKVEGTASINGLVKKSLPVYPNPTANRLSYYVGQNLENASVKIINALGEVVLSEQKSLFKGTHQLDLSMLSTGIYNLVIADFKTFTTTARVIKSN